MISKELLSEVLDNDRIISVNVGVPKNIKTDNLVHYQMAGNYGTLLSINIYELAHKCKEWAFENGYELFSRILSNDHQMSGNCLILRVESDPETVLKIENADAEPDSIFRACQWILENNQK